jgi:hypothetical protein
MLLYIFKSIKDGKLHKGLNYGDSSYGFGKKKKRGLLSDKSDYYGLPYKIYSSTSGYEYERKIGKST